MDDWTLIRDFIDRWTFEIGKYILLYCFAYIIYNYQLIAVLLFSLAIQNIYCNLFFRICEQKQSR